jgi:opacity protein-like surface antigen
MNHKTAIALLATALLLLSGNSYAQMSGYAGAAFGQSDVDVSGFDTASSWQLFGGVNLSQAIAVEAAYTNLGQFDVSGASNTHVDVDGVEFTLIGNIPLFNTVAIFGEAGLFMWDAEATLAGTKIESDSGTDLTYGVGVKIGLMPKVRLQLEYQVYQDVSEENIDTWYAGINFGF